MSAHTITPYDLEQIGKNGSGRIGCKINGFWSHDPITLYVDRLRGIAPTWKVTISHSSGGRDTDEVANDLEAAINFADAMRDLAIIGRDLVYTYGDTLESCYQIGLAERKAESDFEKAVQEAKVKADPAMGEEEATRIVRLMAGGAIKILSYYRRASNHVVSVSVESREKIKFYVNGKSTAKAEVIRVLSELSARRFSQE